jgi:hypothetical protein
MSGTRCKILFSLNLNNSLVCFMQWKQKYIFLLNPNWQTECVLLWLCAGFFARKALKLQSFVPTRGITQKIEVVKYNYLKNLVFWDIRSCIPVQVSHRFGGTWRPPFQNRRVCEARKLHKDVSSREELHAGFLLHLLFVHEVDIFLQIVCRHLIELLGVKFQKKTLFITTAMITANPIHLFCSGFVFLSILWVHI